MGFTSFRALAKIDVGKLDKLMESFVKNFYASKSFTEEDALKLFGPRF